MLTENQKQFCILIIIFGYFFIQYQSTQFVLVHQLCCSAILNYRKRKLEYMQRPSHYGHRVAPIDVYNSLKNTPDCFW
jgi:hypothetical protein